MGPVQSHEIWWNVTLGKFRSPDQYLGGLIQAGRLFRHGNGHVLRSTPCEQSLRRVSLVRKSSHDLHFTHPVSREMIYRRALDMGLALCPASVGPSLSLEYDDQPLGETVNVAMEPLAETGGAPVIYGVEHLARGKMLRVFRGDKEFVWELDRLWVFTLPLAEVEEHN
jgi:hypothetical protein